MKKIVAIVALLGILCSIGFVAAATDEQAKAAINQAEILLRNWAQALPEGPQRQTAEATIEYMKSVQILVFGVKIQIALREGDSPAITDNAIMMGRTLKEFPTNPPELTKLELLESFWDGMEIPMKAEKNAALLKNFQNAKQICLNAFNN
jgi:hypothetical protein